MRYATKEDLISIMQGISSKVSGGGGGASISDWVASTSYSVGDLVIYNYNLYQCTVAHTSTSTFDSTKFHIIGGGSVANAVIDTLWSGGSISQTTGDVLNLSHPYTDYDFVLIKMGAGTQVTNTFILSTASDNTINVMGQGTQDDNTLSFNVVAFSGTTATLSFVLHGSSVTEYIYKIEGIKFLNSNVYSTTEQRIGTWIDGKPLYQKTYTGTFGTITANDTVLREYHEDLSSLNIDKTVEINGIIHDSADMNSTGTSFSASTSLFDKRGAMLFAIGKNSSDNNKLYLYTEVGSWYSEGNFICTIKYTKTTD